MAKPAVTVAPKQSPPKESKPKDNGKMHRRSRSGCFTCRLRRKKCDEGRGMCRACRHLGLQCEYKRPLWWSNVEQRKQMKETIKNIIKRTKTNDKGKHSSGEHAQTMGGDTPPGLSHSLPTSATYTATPQTRAPSDDGSPFVQYQDFNQTPQIQDPYYPYAEPHVLSPPYDTNPYYTQCAQTPYEVDIRTERQMYVDDVPTRKDSSTSTFSTFHPPPGVNPFSSEEWVQDGLYENTDAFGIEQGSDFNYYAHPPPPPFAMSNSIQIEVDEGDRPLLDHFIDNVLRLTLPVYEVNRPGAARSSVILPALASNKCYLHCSLSIAAIHLKSTQRRQDEQIDGDIMRHRVECVQALCAAINDDHHQVLDATLGMIFFPCSVGSPEIDLPDIPWHSHFEAASSLIRKLQLQQTETPAGGEVPQPPFNMSLATWIDILGATMLGRSPLFADTYRVKNTDGTSSGLAELMGCDDRVMYMISEIACLESLKNSKAIDDQYVCHLVRALAEHLDATETRVPLEHAVSSTGAVRPKHLTNNITSVFRLAARVYLCSLVPEANRQQEHVKLLVDRLTNVLEFMPSGPDGFDRSLVWPLLMGGFMSTPESRFRMVFEERVTRLGEHGEFGSFGRATCLLREVWRQADEAERGGVRQSVHWRDVMAQKCWDFLLI